MTMKITGINQVRQALQDMSVNMTVAISRKALKKSGDIVLQEVIARCPVDSGALRNSIKLRRSSKDPNSVRITAGSAQAWYAHLVEYGFTHTSHGAKKKRKATSRGKVEGKNFMRGTAESKFTEVVDTVQDTVVELVNKAISNKPTQVPSGGG